MPLVEFSYFPFKKSWIRYGMVPDQPLQTIPQSLEETIAQIENAITDYNTGKEKLAMLSMRKLFPSFPLLPLEHMMDGFRLPRTDHLMVRHMDRGTTIQILAISKEALASGGTPRLICHLIKEKDERM